MLATVFDVPRGVDVGVASPRFSTRPPTRTTSALFVVVAARLTTVRLFSLRFVVTASVLCVWCTTSGGVNVPRDTVARDTVFASPRDVDVADASVASVGITRDTAKAPHSLRNTSKHIELALQSFALEDPLPHSSRDAAGIPKHIPSISHSPRQRDSEFDSL